jgi:hypothetical protein
MSTQPPASGFLTEESTMDYGSFFADFFKLVTTTNPVDALKLQIKWYDDMVLAGEKSLSDLMVRRDDLIDMLLNLEPENAEAEEHTEATEANTVAE